MPTMVSLKDNAPPEAFEKAKAEAQEQGGKITDESTSLFPRFTVEFPEGHVHTLRDNEHIEVEEDQEVRTQKA